MSDTSGTTQTANRWLAMVAILAVSMCAASAQAASPIPISACPYMITTPGNYVLTRDLTGAGTCISLAAPIDNVGLDFQGHNIAGNGTGWGVVCVSPGGQLCNNVIIVNGTVAQFSTGIFITGNSNTVAGMTVKQSTGADNARFDDGSGIILAGHQIPDTRQTLTVVTNSVSAGNSGTGISADSLSIVSDSRANNNGRDGIDSYTIVNSEANNNGGFGIQSTGYVTGSTARGNALGGIAGGGNSGGAISVMNSTASSNGDDGIAIGTGLAGATTQAGSITDSDANNNGGRGIFLTCPAAAFGNTARKNASGNLVTTDDTCVLLNNKTQQ